MKNITFEPHNLAMVISRSCKSDQRERESPIKFHLQMMQTTENVALKRPTFTFLSVHLNCPKQAIHKIRVHPSSQNYITTQLSQLSN